MCDRIAVMAQGRLSSPQLTGSLSVEEVGVMMGGGVSDAGDVRRSERQRMPDWPFRLEAPAPSRAMRVGCAADRGCRDAGHAPDRLFAALGTESARRAVSFFVEPIASIYGIGELLLKATPLMLARWVSRSAFARTSGTSARKVSSPWAPSPAAESRFLGDSLGVVGAARCADRRECWVAWRGPRFLHFCARAFTPARSS